MVKIFKKKELFIYLYAFFKAFKRKKSAYKNIWTKVTYYIISLIFCAYKKYLFYLFYAYKKYLEQKLFITSRATIFMHLFLSA